MPRLWANAILKFNRAQLRKKKVRKLKDLYEVTAAKNYVDLKKVSKEEMRAIKTEIRKQAKLEMKRATGIWFVSFLLTIVILIIIYYLLIH